VGGGILGAVKAVPRVSHRLNLRGCLKKRMFRFDEREKKLLY